MASALAGGTPTSRKMLSIATSLLALLCVSASAFGVERNPPPDFESGYQLPATQQPQPRPEWMEYADVGVLAGALALASWLALRRRSRAGILVLMLVCLAYFGFYRKGCICPIGAEQNVALGLLGSEKSIHLDTARMRELGVSPQAAAETVVEFVDDLSQPKFSLVDLNGAPDSFELRVKMDSASTKALEALRGITVESSAKQPPAALVAATSMPASSATTTSVPATATSRPAMAKSVPVKVALGQLLTDPRPSYVVPAYVVGLLALPLIFTLLFGRTFCASVCPLGAIQDIVIVRPMKVPAWLEHTLGIMSYVLLAAGVFLAVIGASFVICRYDPFVGFFRRSGAAYILVLGGLLLVIGMFVARPYCRFLCPLGAVFRALSRLSWRHVTITPDKCIHCRLCEDACPFGAINKPSEPLAPHHRIRGRIVLGALLLLLPVLTIGGGYVGSSLGMSASRLHPTVRLAERIYLEDTGKVAGVIDASKAFRNTGTPTQRLYRQARTLREDYLATAWWAGAFVGFVLGLKLILLSVRRTRTDYEPDRARCLSCGRCFRHCPMEHQRLRKLHGGAAPLPNT